MADIWTGIKEENLDRSVSPGQDFFRFSCGGWLDANPIPNEFSSYGTYDELAELNRKQLKDLIDGIIASNNAPGSDAARIADLYSLVMDTDRRNSEQFGPLKPYRERIALISSLDELLAMMIELDSVTRSTMWTATLRPVISARRSRTTLYVCSCWPDMIVGSPAPV